MISVFSQVEIIKTLCVMFMQTNAISRNGIALLSFKDSQLRTIIYISYVALSKENSFNETFSYKMHPKLKTIILRYQTC